MRAYHEGHVFCGRVADKEREMGEIFICRKLFVWEREESFRKELLFPSYTRYSTISLQLQHKPVLSVKVVFCHSNCNGQVLVLQISHLWD